MRRSTGEGWWTETMMMMMAVVGVGEGVEFAEFVVADVVAARAQRTAVAVTVEGVQQSGGAAGDDES